MEDLAGTLYAESDARVVDMSLTGLAIESTARLKPGNRYSIELADGRGRLRLSASVCWCHLEGTREVAGETLPIYLAGLRFREVIDEEATEILGLLKEHVTIELERHLFGRFQLREEKLARVAEKHELAIRTISLSGMMALTTERPRKADLVDLELPGGDRRLELAGRVTYAKELLPEDEPYRAEIGIEFLGLDPGDRLTLETLLVEYLR